MENANFSIPVIVDSVKNMDDFQMTRCSYFTVQSDDPSQGWALDLEKVRIPFLALSVSGVLWRPLEGDIYFDAAHKIAELFDAIEAIKNQYVDSDDLWLLNSLLQQTGPPTARGQVYRIEHRLFVVAHSFRNYKMTEESFFTECNELAESVRFSESETEAYSEWALNQVEIARSEYNLKRNTDQILSKLEDRQ